MVDNALVDEVPVWLEINKTPAVTWMCTPEKLEELAVGWLHGENYIDTVEDLLSLRPCATDLGFWAEVDPGAVTRVEGGTRQSVLASGCGAVTTYLAEPADVDREPPRGAPPPRESLRGAFKALFRKGERYKETGGIHAAALVEDGELLNYAEDIGRHNAVDKVIGARLLDRGRLRGLGMLVTGRISAELSFKASRAGFVYVATPSVPSTLAAKVARRSGMYLIGRAVSGSPHIHRPDKG